MLKVHEHRRHAIEQIFGQRAEPKMCLDSSAEADSRCCRLEGRQRLRLKAEDNTRQDVARRRRGQSRWEITVDNSLPIGRFDHRISNFEDDDSAVRS